MEDKKQIKITASEERRRKIKSKASAEGITVQDLFDGWIDEWLVGKKSTATKAAVEADGDSSEFVDENEKRLRRILHLVMVKGSEKDKTGIEANLEWVEGKLGREVDDDEPKPAKRRRAVVNG